MKKQRERKKGLWENTIIVFKYLKDCHIEDKAEVLRVVLEDRQEMMS